jgi:hypothetical protein
LRVKIVEEFDSKKLYIIEKWFLGIEWINLYNLVKTVEMSLVPNIKKFKKFKVFEFIKCTGT